MGHIINIGYGGNTAVTRSEAYNAYVASIRTYKVLPQEEEEKLLREYTSISDEKRKIEIRNILLNANQRFVITAAKQYANGDTNIFLDMISEANLGFIEAIENYDFAKKRGKKLFSWAAWYVRRQCNLYLINHRSMVYQSNSHATYHKLAKARSFLSQKLGRDASDEEVKDFLIENGTIIKDVRDVRRVTVSSIDSTASVDEDDFNQSLAEFNTATAENNSFERDTEKAYASTMIQSALSTLKDRDREIIEMLYGLNDENIEYSNEAVADRFGFTPERIRQIHSAALKKMAKKAKMMKKKM